METNSIKNPNSGKNKQWSRSSLIAAVAAGALTTEAANLILKQLEPDPEPIPDIVLTPDDSETGEEIAEATPVEETATTQGHSNQTATEPAASSTPEPISEATVAQTTEPTTEPVTAQTTEPAAEPVDDPADSDLVDVIVEEVDPNDNDMADVINVDEIGTVYTTDGQELAAAVIHDADGGQALLVDVDGDNVYDVITTESGEVIAQAGGDIDVSDVEQMYAAQHGDTGYLASNDFDNNMTTETESIQDDIQVS